MGLSMKGSGLMTFNMGRGWKRGPMEVGMKDFIRRGRNMDGVNIIGMIIATMRDIGKII